MDKTTKQDVIDKETFLEWLMLLINEDVRNADEPDERMKFWDEQVEKLKMRKVN